MEISGIKSFWIVTPCSLVKSTDVTEEGIRIEGKAKKDTSKSRRHVAPEDRDGMPLRIEGGLAEKYRER
jgi:hypothetical protein